MTAKKSKTWSKVLLNLVMTIPALFNIVTHFVSCIEYDVFLAKKNLISIVVLSFFAAIIMAGAWLSIWAMIFIWLLNWPLNPIAVFAIILTAHVILLLLISIFLMRLKNNMLFYHTRKLFHSDSN